MHAHIIQINSQSSSHSPNALLILDGRCISKGFLYSIKKDYLHASAGAYTITLTVTDDDGGSATISIAVAI
ncbi:MAG: hypothetical protein ACE5QW_04605 [Thermoplasmata archaeon]